MQKHYLALALLILFFSNVFAQYNKEEQRVLDLSARKFVWMEEKKADSLESILDENIRYIHSNGWIQKKKDVIDDLKSNKLVLQNVIIEEVNVRLYESTAIVNGTGKFTGNLNSNPFDLHLLYTEVYVKKEKKWLLVSRHANKLP